MAFGVGEAKTVAVAGIFEAKAGGAVVAAGIGGSKTTAVVEDFLLQNDHAGTGDTGGEQGYVVKRAVAVVQRTAAVVSGVVGLRVAEVDRQVVGYKVLLADMSDLEM